MASASIQLPNFELKVLNDDKSIEDSTIFDVKNNRPMVIDLWHTKCKNCPAALEKLNKIAIKRTDILFVACAISQGEGNEEEVADLIDEWNGLSHVYISIEVKEQLKVIFGFTQVPFAIVIDVVSITSSCDVVMLSY